MTKYFLGLPVPGAAGILASFVLSYELFGDTETAAKTIPALMHKMPVIYRFIPVTMMILSFLMISPVRYGNFKQLKLGSPQSLRLVTLMAAGVLLIFIYPQNMIFVLFSLYVLSGLIVLAVRFYFAQRAKRMGRRMRRRSTDVQDDKDNPLTIIGR